MAGAMVSGIEGLARWAACWVGGKCETSPKYVYGPYRSLGCAFGFLSTSDPIRHRIDFGEGAIFRFELPNAQISKSARDFFVAEPRS